LPPSGQAPPVSPSAGPPPVPKPALPAPPAPAAPPVVPPAQGPFPWPTIGVLPPLTPAAPVTPTAASPAAAGAVPDESLEDLWRRTTLGAYGQAQLFVDEESNTRGRFPLAVFSLAHRPIDSVRIAIALELDDIKTVGLQQALLEVSPLRQIGVRAGLMIVPVGLANVSPEPTTFLTVDRPLTDQLIIPYVWREVGAGLFGELVPGLRYEADVLGGLDGTGFTAAAPIWNGPGDGHDLAIHDVAGAGRLELHDLPQGLTLGASGYLGGATHGVAALSGLRVGIAEADLRYRVGGLDFTAEYARLYVVNSYLVNEYLGLLGQSAVPSRGRGFYVQAGYDFLRLAAPETPQALVLFAGYENIDPRSAMSPYNYNPPAITGPGQLAPEAPSPARQFVRGGIDYRPRPFIALKVDVQVALDSTMPVTAPQVAAGAPGTPRPLGSDISYAARGATRVGLALAYSF
ncbi:MAG TPA: hypothetical protein VHG72_09380, partial [Polyangia bacterium]|nr:hypothetical protein [Polyangia bacterium]